MREAERAVPYIDRGEPLPQSYAENRIVALVRDPEYIFTYWDVESRVRVAGSDLVVRVHSLSEGGSYDIQSGSDTDNWYLRVTPNRVYQFELYEKLPSGELGLLASSSEVTTPVRWEGGSGSEARAEILHAERHPLSRKRRAVAAHVGRAVHPPASPDRAPVPVAPPVERVFAYTYVWSRKG